MTSNGFNVKSAETISSVSSKVIHLTSLVIREMLNSDSIVCLTRPDLLASNI